MSEFVKLVGENIRLVRKAQGITQEKLSEMSGLSEKYLSDTERGVRNISLESLEKIMQALKIKPYELFLFAGAEEAITDKQKLIEMFQPLLADRNVNEIQFLLRIAQDFVSTFEKSNNHYTD
ncbi:helix-turn-helix domain-containing protein [Paenibacillus aceti]|uniref:Transcriptional regulator n=1 Tax=Paenibacillus aceti TaxID=1820010 RepID=A0ABQ1W088_9BACL|nr:helix-turn-helix transcriptional regulator [Paenibacillus aceti]GGG06966.1 transcriptional regulator [Paenibacillus aceti]